MLNLLKHPRTRRRRGDEWMAWSTTNQGAIAAGVDRLWILLHCLDSYEELNPTPA